MSQASSLKPLKALLPTQHPAIPPAASSSSHTTHHRRLLRLLRIHRAAIRQQLGGALLPLGIFECLLAAPGAALPDAEECECQDGDGGRAAGGGPDGELGRGREGVPFLRDGLRGAGVVVAVELEGLRGATQRVELLAFDRVRTGVLGGYILEDLDALPRTRLVPVSIRCPSTRVRHAHRLDRHGVRCVVVVCHTARPLDRAVGFARIATSPDAQAQVHRCLREVIAAVGVSVHQRPDDRAVDVPVQLLRRPVDRVVVEGLLWCLDRVVDSARIARRVALAKVVRLDVAVVTAHEFPVHFVQIVGFQHHGGDDALACRGLHNHFNLAEKDVEVCLHGWRLEALVYDEFSAVGAVVNDAIGDVPDSRAHGFGCEVNAVVCDAEGEVVWAVG